MCVAPESVLRQRFGVGHDAAPVEAAGMRRPKCNRACGADNDTARDPVPEISHPIVVGYGAVSGGTGWPASRWKTRSTLPRFSS